MARFSCLFLGVGVCALLSSSARAQNLPAAVPIAPAASIDGAGAATIEVVPNQIFMRLSVQGKGKSIEEALARLTERLAKAETSLTEIGAVRGSVIASEPQISSGMTQQEQQIRTMLMRQRSPRRTKVPAASTAVVVVATLDARWKMAGSTPAEMLAFSHTLAEKIKQADPSGANEKEELTPEEEELREEMAQAMSEYGMEAESKNAAPQFVFLARVADEQYQAALTDCFQKAQDEAAILAKAAGTQLGALQSLSSQDGQANEYNEVAAYTGDYEAAGAAARVIEQLRTQLGAKTRLAYSLAPGTIKYHVRVAASFHLK